MASILIMSLEADGAPIAFHLAKEGHFVKMCIKEEWYRKTFKGFKNPSLVSNPSRTLDQFDLVLFDMAGWGDQADEIREKGRLVLGGGSINDKLELDRSYGLKVVRSLTKLQIPKGVEISNLAETIKSLEQAGRPMVIKPLGNKSTMFTLVSEDKKNRALIGAIKAMPDLLPAIIQEAVDGIEISTEGWFNGKEWTKPFNHTIEKKRLMEGDKGPNTGCMGNVVWLSFGDKLTTMALEPLVPLLARVGYVGPLDVNCIVTPDQAYFLEFTARFGYDALQALTELLRGGLFEYLWAVATRGNTERMFLKDQIAMAVRLSVPPWPNTTFREGMKDIEGLQVIDAPEEALKHVWFADVKLDEGGKYVLAGVDGMVGCLTARGENLREARRRVYRSVQNLVIHRDVQWRYDIDKDVETDIQQLVDWGWIRGEKNGIAGGSYRETHKEGISKTREGLSKDGLPESSTGT